MRRRGVRDYGFGGALTGDCFGGYFESRSATGRGCFGWATDYVSTRLVAGIALLTIAAGLVMFATLHETWQLIYTLPVFGIGFGGIIPVRSSLQVEYFGLKSFGAIQGMTLTVATVGAFFGPVMAGVLYDLSESYRLAFVLLAVGPLVAIPLLLPGAKSRD